MSRKYLLISPNGKHRYAKEHGTENLTQIRCALPGYTLFCQDDFSLPMNVFANPVIDEDELLRLAVLAGPYGTVVLHKEDGINKNEILDIYRKYDLDNMDDYGEDDPLYESLLPGNGNNDDSKIEALSEELFKRYIFTVEKGQGKGRGKVFFRDAKDNLLFSVKGNEVFLPRKRTPFGNLDGDIKELAAHLSQVI